jgi:hypothetical protein
VATSCSTQVQQPERALPAPADRYDPQRQRAKTFRNRAATSYGSVSPIDSGSGPR